MALNPNYYICRLCGYIHKGKESPSICPACGAPASSFVPYKMGAEENRTKILDFDIHPVLTHFGVGISVLLAVVMLINYANPTVGGINFGYNGVLTFLVIALPIAVGLTALSGLLDGKMRYKKLKTPYLQYKIYFGIALFVSSILVVIFHFTSQNGAITALYVLESIFIFVSLVLAAILGFIGKELTGNIVPRGRELPKEKVTEEKKSE